ncbi:MAG: hypothetical protein ABIJ30_02430 [bacterium]
MATTAVKEIFAALPYIKKVGVKHLWFGKHSVRLTREWKMHLTAGTGARD